MIHYILNYEGGKSIDFHALRPPGDQGARWRLRQSATEILANLAEASSSGACTFALLVNRRSEIEVLEQVVRHSEGNRMLNWKIEQPEVHRSVLPNASENGTSTI
jgi:hypothetical protein